MSAVSELEARLAFAVAIATEAGREALKWFHADALDVARKGDGTPVTIADRAAERLLRERIGARFPDDGIEGEEEGVSEGRGIWRWIVDPIDGTRSFLHGVPLFGTLVGLEREGEPLVGVIELPALDERVFAARGLGATWQRAGASRPARVSTTARLEDALACFTNPRLFHRHGRARLLSALVERVPVTRGWSDCYAHALLATGRADLVVEPIMAVWDCAALAPVVEEAGGTFTDLAGRRTIRGGHALSTNGHLFEAALVLAALDDHEDTAGARAHP